MGEFMYKYESRTQFGHSSYQSTETLQFMPFSGRKVIPTWANMHSFIPIYPRCDDA